jgi:hypothetical protein
MLTFLSARFYLKAIFWNIFHYFVIFKTLSL